MQLEGNAVRPYTYSHDTRYGSYSNYRQPMAHPMGANFGEFVAIVRYQPFPKLNLVAKTFYTKIGRDTTFGKIIEIVEAAKSAADVVHAMNEHGAWRERARNIKHRRQLCVLDFDFVERLLRARLIFADDCSHRLADKSNLADGQQGMIFYGVAIIRMKRAEIICREHVNDSRLALGLGNVDGENFGVRKRAAEQLGPGHAFESNVACVGGASRHLGHAIGARNGMIHDGKVLRVILIYVAHDFACFLSVGPCNSAEACRMAFSIPRYPVQRQRLPLM